MPHSKHPTRRRTPRLRASVIALLSVSWPLCSSAWSQARPVPARAAAQGDYRLGPDDVLSITVLRHPELSSEQVSVPASGRIDLPEAGGILVTGKTTSQLAAAIRRALRRTMVAPEVTVSLRQARTRRLFVLGAVAKPGVYDIRPNWRVTEALAAAGGLPGRADETTATLARAGGQPVSIDLEAILDNPASPQNRPLLPDDVLLLQALEAKRITVSGDVLKPDVYPLRRAPRLLDALNAAGGLRQRSSATRGFLLRGGKRIELALADAVDLRDSRANIALQNGDLLTLEGIPPLRVTVTGPFVRNAGNFDLAPDAGVVQAIAQAGGLTVPAEQVVASVRRGGQVLAIDLARAAVDPAADVALQSGDAVLINEPQIIRVQVTGQVNRPGPLRLPPNTPVLDAISSAGGLSVKPESARINILRNPSRAGSAVATLAGATPAVATAGAAPFAAPFSDDRLALQVDPVALLTLSDLRQNTRLQDGDLISVTQIQSAIVTISGEVARPGPYEVREGEGIPELIARAGGQTPEALLSRVAVQRGGQVRAEDVYDAVRTGGKSNASLQAGDFVVVPRNEARVIVMQAVARPGSYAIPENRTLTVTDALSLAGGPRDRAAIKQVALLRPNPKAENGVERRIIALDKIYKGDLSENIALRNGDVIYVPEASTKGSPFGALGQIIGTLTGLRYLTGG